MHALIPCMHAPAPQVHAKAYKLLSRMSGLVLDDEAGGYAAFASYANGGFDVDRGPLLGMMELSR